jgi:hypothetical protein
VIHLVLLSTPRFNWLEGAKAGATKVENSALP